MKVLLVVGVFTRLCLALQATFAETKRGFETVNIVLYHPDPVLRDRGISAEALSAYIKKLQAACVGVFADETKPDSLDVVIAVKPGMRSRVWFISATRSQGDSRLDSLGRKLESIGPPGVLNGPVVFAISATIAGAERKPPDSKEGFSPPTPREWEEASRKLGGQAAYPDDILQIIWPDEAEPEIPEGVRYIKASAAANEKASDLLRDAFTSQPFHLAELNNKGSGQQFMVGPFLTGNLTQNGSIDASRFLPVLYAIPLDKAKGITAQMSGLAARSAEQRSDLDQALAKWIAAGPDIRIRKLSPRELALIWYFISWDVNEPIFVIEHGGRSLVVNFYGDGKSIFWLEDISAPCFHAKLKGGASTPCYCSVVNQEGSKYFVDFEPRGGEDACSAARTNKSGSEK
jgi:hypothetical protein